MLDMHSPDQILAIYNDVDAAMRSRLSVPEVQSFSTSTFDQIGWPHSVIKAIDLVRYTDWCNHPGANDYFGPGAMLPTQCAHLEFTQAEAELLRKISKATAEFTFHLGREVRPVLNHLAQIGPFRIMMEIKNRMGLDRLTVFDVGAGSGYQSALLSLAGQRTLLTDNAQGLYLFQAGLLKACCPGKVRDWLLDPMPNDKLDSLVHMVPWWDYLGLRHSAISDVDIFFCNNNLGEMNYGAAAYTAFLAKKLTANSKARMFFFTCLGSPKQSAIEMIDELLKRVGFVNVVWGPFWLYTLADNQLPSDLFDFLPEIPKWRATTGEKLLSVLDVIDVTEETLPTDLDFVRFTGVFDIRKHVSELQDGAPSENPQEVVKGNSSAFSGARAAWDMVKRW